MVGKILLPPKDVISLSLESVNMFLYMAKRQFSLQIELRLLPIS